MADAPPTGKAQLRREMRAMLKSVSATHQNVAAQVAAWVDSQPGVHRIATFAALPGEPDLSALLERFPHRSWCLPRVVNAETLIFHKIRRIDELICGAFGILEPVADAREIPVETIDAFLCPGLAFDRRGGRLGRGRGYYDRLLESARNDALRIGVCFENQIVTSTFPDTHDIPMHLLICESGVITPVG